MRDDWSAYDMQILDDALCEPDPIDARWAKAVRERVQSMPTGEEWFLKPAGTLWNVCQKRTAYSYERKATYAPLFYSDALHLRLLLNGKG
jgi:hypothetical protein